MPALYPDTQGKSRSCPSYLRALRLLRPGLPTAGEPGMGEAPGSCPGLGVPRPHLSLPLIILSWEMAEGAVAASGWQSPLLTLQPSLSSLPPAELNFGAITLNSMDATSERDFVGKSRVPGPVPKQHLCPQPQFLGSPPTPRAPPGQAGTQSACHPLLPAQWSSCSGHPCAGPTSAGWPRTSSSTAPRSSASCSSPTLTGEACPHLRPQPALAPPAHSAAVCVSPAPEAA